MSKIESIKLHNLRNTEHFQFMTDLDSSILKYQALGLGIDDLYPAFKNALTSEDVALRVEQGSSQSKNVEDLDKLRDQTWNAIATRVKSASLSPFAEEAENGRVIKRIIDLYGDVRGFSYNEESGAINNLVTDLMHPVNSTITDQIGITAWVTELKNVNDKFQAMFNARNLEYAGRESGDVRSARKPVDDAYNQIVERINAHVVLGQGNQVINGFVDELNEKIKYYRNTLSARNSRHKEQNKTTEKAG